MTAAAHPSPRPDPAIRRWIARELAADPPRAPSLIITTWGDSIAPHGGATMLAGLIDLLAPLGVNERLVRTSVFRLIREGWLAAKPVGRRSLYRLTPSGARRFGLAYARIYSAVEPTWSDDWELVVGDGLTGAERRELREGLSWEGFGQIEPGVFGRPARPHTNLPRIIATLGLQGRLLTVRARDDASLGGQPLASIVARTWNVAALSADYRAFLKRFGSVVERFRIRAQDGLDPQQCFVTRTLLVHAYRRVLLRDPQLPAALLPLDWPGAAAAALCADLYRLTHRGAEHHLAATLEGPAGPLPPANDAYYARFGGLPR